MLDLTTMARCISVHIKYGAFSAMKLTIPNMKCGGCADSVTSALRKLDATAPIEIDLDTKEVEFGGSASRAVVVSALAAAGYPAANAQ